jgi:hypothetical protein
MKPNPKEPTKGDELKAFEKAGKLKITLRSDTNHLTVEFVVPEDYPKV